MREITGKVHYQHRDFSAPAPKRVDELSKMSRASSRPIINHESDGITKPSGAKASKSR
jgi:hypothetical protein